MNCFILGSTKNRYCNALKSEFEKRGITARIAGFESLVGSIANSRQLVELDSRSVAKGDLMLVRSMPLGSLEQVIFRMNAIQQAESIGVSVVNQARSLELAIDKYLCSVKLQQNHIPVIPTFTCESADHAIAAFEELGNDVVVKPLFGGEGRGMIRLSDIDLAWRSFRTLERTRSVILVQKYIEAANRDIRAFLIGTKCLAIERHNPDDWRANISRGATAQAIDLTEKQKNLALKCAEISGCEICGVDLIRDQQGNEYVLEVNAVPGWQAIETSYSCNIADLIAEYVLEQHAGRVGADGQL